MESPAKRFCRGSSEHKSGLNWQDLEKAIEKTESERVKAQKELEETKALIRSKEEALVKLREQLSINKAKSFVTDMQDRNEMHGCAPPEGLMDCLKTLYQEIMSRFDEKDDYVDRCVFCDCENFPQFFELLHRYLKAHVSDHVELSVGQYLCNTWVVVRKKGRSVFLHALDGRLSSYRTSSRYAPVSLRATLVSAGEEKKFLQVHSKRGGKNSYDYKITQFMMMLERCVIPVGVTSFAPFEDGVWGYGAAIDISEEIVNNLTTNNITIFTEDSLHTMKQILNSRMLMCTVELRTLFVRRVEVENSGKFFNYQLMKVMRLNNSAWPRLMLVVAYVNPDDKKKPCMRFVILFLGIYLTEKKAKHAYEQINDKSLNMTEFFQVLHKTFDSDKAPPGVECKKIDTPDDEFKIRKCIKSEIFDELTSTCDKDEIFKAEASKGEASKAEASKAEASKAEASICVKSEPVDD